MPHFTGFKMEEWRLLESFIPPEPIQRRRGMPHTSWKMVLNSIVYVLFTESRCCDIA